MPAAGEQTIDGTPLRKLMDSYHHEIHSAREHLVIATITESTRDYQGSRAALERADGALRRAKAKSVLLLGRIH